MDTSARPRPFDITPGSAQPTRGVLFFTDAINSNGNGLSMQQRPRTVEDAAGVHAGDSIDVTYPDTLVPPPPAPAAADPVGEDQPYRHAAGPQRASGTNHIETVLFTDGLKRDRQTKKEAYAEPAPPLLCYDRSCSACFRTADCPSSAFKC